MPDGAQRITIYDVARVAGASITTVSHVLNNTRNVRQETKRRVLEAVQALNYRPNSLARALVRHETGLIAMVIPSTGNPFFGELGAAIEARSFAAGYNVITCNAERSVAKADKYLEMLVDKRIDGIIYISSDRSTGQLQPLIRHQIPMVTFDRDFTHFDSILLDNFQGGYLATHHLLELGHRHIACVTGSQMTSRASDRYRGYYQALTDVQAPFQPDWIIAGNWDYESGRRAAHRLASLDPRPTAAFAMNDAMAIGLLAGLSEVGLAVPADLSVVGYDDISIARYTTPPLTTISSCIAEAGSQLCQMLLNRIQGAYDDDVQKITIGCDLIVRGSTAPATGRLPWQKHEEEGLRLPGLQTHTLPTLPPTG
jgi:LacI family transcriptional regulator